MAEDELVEKTPVRKSRDIITQLKEMQHFSRTNIEKLSAFWLQLDESSSRRTWPHRSKACLIIRAGSTRRGGVDRGLRGAMRRHGQVGLFAITKQWPT